MRYVYKDPVVAVPAPKELSLPVSASTDTLHDLLQRREEARKNRLLLHLTESDCERICTNSTEKRFTAGQVIVAEGEVISALYRIKSGKVSLMKGEVKLYDLPQGHFLGEGLFIRGNAQDAYRASLVANGPTVLSQVNLPFVRHLIDMDKVLAFKIYRHIAGKLSALLFAMVGKMSESGMHRDSTASVGSDSDVASPSLSASTGSSVSSDGDPRSPGRAAVAMADDMLNLDRSRVKKKKKTLHPHGRKDVAFKTYQLQETHPGAQAVLFTRKLVITNPCKLGPRRKIKYNKILDMAKTGKSSVTIIYGVQARTIFFKDEAELSEFYGLVQSLILTGVGSTAHLPSAPPLSQSGALLPNPLARSASIDPVQAAADKLALAQLAVRQDVVKGDIIVAEGDLYQRIYTVASGELCMRLSDTTSVTIGEGEVFGVVTLFHMRPANITIEVSSDTATLLIIPNYKIQELISSNFQLAARVHKKAAQLVYSQIERILQGPGQGYSLAGLLI